jgi:branched-chain amino acid transport system permease protein
VTSLGIYIMLVAATAIVWGSEAQSLRVGVDRVFRLGIVRITEGQVQALIAGSVLLLALFIALERTRLGLQLRALADNPREFVLRGHDRTRVRMMAFLVSGLLASVAALLVARDVGFSATSGLPALLVAIVAVIVGGRSSFLGPVVGAIIVMILRAEVTWMLAARWQDAATFALLAIVLYVRPMGLVGVRSRLEEAS